MDDEDLITTRTLIKETGGILPGTLPYTLMSMDSTFSGIASAKRYYIEFHLYDGSGMDLDYTISLLNVFNVQFGTKSKSTKPSDSSVDEPGESPESVDGSKPAEEGLDLPF